MQVSSKIAYPIIIAGVFIIVAIMGFNYENLNINFYIIFSILLVYIFLFGFATGQNFARPVRRMVQKAGDLSKGDLKTRFYAEGKDELGELARILNKIAEDFEESKYKNENIEKSVDIKVKARTQELEEVIRALEQKVKNRTLELQRISTELGKVKNRAGIKTEESPAIKKQDEAEKEPLKKERKVKEESLQEDKESVEKMVL